MKKIHILKTIIDFIWILTLPTILIILIFIPMLFINDNITDFNLGISGIQITTIDNVTRVLLSISMILFFLPIYCIYKFRKILRYFLANKIFDNYVITGFKVIGNLLIITGGTMLIISVIAKLYIEQKVFIELGMNSNLVIICLGLFFMVLSEFFKIAKTAKQENDLTI
jgi:hypothetical protein